MKPRYVVATAVLCLSWSVAKAVGGGGSQGTLFLGQDLDWQHTATEEQQLFSFNVLSFPPPATNYPTNSVNIKLRSCTELSPVHASCKALVRLRPGHSHSQFCGQWLPEDGGERPVTLYAFSGRFGNRGYFRVEISETFSLYPFPFLFWPSPVNVTFACGLTSPGTVEWSNLGAMGKCVLWPKDNFDGFQPGISQDSIIRFNACIRAIRADYCGDGVTYTWDETQIYLYDVPSSGVPATYPGVPPEFTLEANWDDHGAICLHHVRYEQLAPECKKRFRQTKLDGGYDYYCRNGPGDFNRGPLMDYSQLN
jgi:hypothetical protein